MLHKVLVAYGTTNGSTARIAEAIADVLCQQGLTDGRGHVRPVHDERGVVGGGLYAQRWHKDARRFVGRQISAMSRAARRGIFRGPQE